MDQKKEWDSLWTELRLFGVRGSGDDIYAELVRRYSEPHRAYHTLEHIQALLALFPMVRPYCFVPQAVLLAVWFHDAVYDPRGSSNEEQSGDLLRQQFQHRGLSAEVLGLTYDLILATKHVSPTASDTTRALIELDLSILGADDAEYDRYEEQIRREYNFVPDEIFYPTRARFMGAIEARGPIFFLPEMSRRFEDKAHANIRRTLARYPKP